MEPYVDDDIFERTVDDAEQQGQASGPKVFSDGNPLPKLIIFDLDYTLWPFWVDTHVSPPLKAVAGNTAVKDRSGDKLSFYPSVPSILYSLHSLNVPAALASRTSAPGLAEKMLKLLHVPAPAADAVPTTTAAAADSAGPSHPSSSTVRAPLKAWDFFKYREIFPGDKKTHMRNLHKASGVAYEDMVFFDDERRNANVRQLGVFFWLVPDGVTGQEVDRAITAWRKDRGPADVKRVGSGEGLAELGE